MNTLLVDIGNSRIKWALQRDDRMSRMQAVTHDNETQFSQWLLRAPKIDAVYAVNVAGDRAEARLRRALKKAKKPAPRFYSSATNAAGVRSGYADAWRLGNDRWVGLIGAWHLGGCKRAVCAVSAGTALTIDVVDASGQHRGGLIAPGPTLMVSALLRGTHGIESAVTRNSAWSSSTRGRSPVIRPLADNTGDALELGSLLAAAALIDRTIREVAGELEQRPKLFLTGGSANVLAPLLQSKHLACEDLVLRGLTTIAGIPMARKA
jgi:type III pantothenate kinase